MQCLFRVREVYEHRDRGLVVVGDRAMSECDFNLKLGDPIEIRTSEGTVLRTHVAGFEFAGPFDPQRELSFLLPHGVDLDQVALGAEVWLAD